MTEPSAPIDIFEGPGPHIFSISPGEPFLRILAASVRRAISPIGSIALADVEIYLPTRRAVRKLHEEFVATAGEAKASLLPTIRALGDVDEDELAVFAGRSADNLQLPPAVSATERRFALARLAAARNEALGGRENWAGALASADELGKLLDSLYTEEVSPGALENLAPEAMAAHWAESLKFLSIVTQAWPAYLTDTEQMDPADRRVSLINLQTQFWRDHLPDHPVIIAGTTGSTPAVGRMMKAVADFPRGAVVLPGLDLDSENAVWEGIDEPHPQSGLKDLLARSLDIERHAVSPLGGQADRRPRSALLSVALRPAQSSDSWRDWAVAVSENREALDKALKGLTLAEAPDEEREADFAALKIRETLARPDATVFLVTPDRDLARRVCAKLKRWDIDVDDSAGVPFANTTCGVYLRLAARWMVSPDDAVALMALINHPYFCGGFDANQYGAIAQSADLALRGLRPTSGVSGIIERLRKSKTSEPLAELIEQMEIDAHREKGSLSALLAQHLALAEALAATPSQTGEERLWAGEAGQTGAEALAGLTQIADSLGEIDARHYADIFDQLIASVTVRRTRPSHPRVAILGPLEARLQTADVVILCGLNEGVWPRDAAIDPFLSRAMRRKLGLPSPERRIGLAAHDFAQLTALPEVMLTRAIKVGGKPSKPSRWIVRLKNILTGAKALETIDMSAEMIALAGHLDAIDAVVTIPPPSPRPPVAARPTTFAVTRIEKLIRDPYAIYGRDILRLRKLDELNEPVDARHIGILLHAVFEDFIASHGQKAQGSVDEDITRLTDIYDNHLAGSGIDPRHWAFLTPRVHDALRWFAGWRREVLLDAKPVLIEGKGEWRFALDGRDFTLSARADRIDQRDDGGVVIYDYKTGRTPPTDAAQAAFSPQLALTALIAENGGFEALGKAAIHGFQFVKILNRKDSDNKDSDAKKSGDFGAAAREKIDDAREGLLKLLSPYNDQQTPYLSQPRPQLVDDYGDYDHLARRRERNLSGESE